MAEPVATGLIRFQLASGVTITVAPLTLSMRQSLYRQALEMYPDPEADDFASAVQPDPNAFDAAAAADPRTTPEFQAMLAKQVHARERYVTDMAIDIAVDTDDRERLEERLRAFGERVRVNTPAAYRTTLWVTLLTVLLASETEMQLIVEGIRSILPLSAGEVADGYSYFRVDVQRYIATRVTQDPVASSAQTPIPD